MIPQTSSGFKASRYSIVTVYATAPLGVAPVD
jgi:hypothetical protein